MKKHKRMKQAQHSELFRQVLNVDWPLVICRAGSHPHEAQYTDEYGRTALHLACMPADLPTNVINCLINACPQATLKQNKWGCIPLHCACLYSDSKVVQRLLEVSPNAIHVKNEDGYTPLLHMMKWFEFNFQRGLAMLNRNYRSRPSSNRHSVLHKDPELDRLWRNACLLVTASYYGTVQDVGKAPSLHAFAGVADCPGVLFDFALTLQKEDLYRQDWKGDLPLHIASAISSLVKVATTEKGDNERSVVEKLVDADPLAAKVFNHAGDLPLHLAIRDRKSAFDSDVLKICHAYPGAFAVFDSMSRLFPFMLTAVGEYASLNATYMFLRACPELERLTVR